MADDLEALNDAMFAVLDGEDATSLVDAVRAARDAGADLHAWWFEAASWAITESSMVLLDALAQAGVDWPGLHAVGETGEDRAPLIDCLLAQALTSGVTTPELVIDLGESVTFNIVSLREYLPLGQRVEAFALDVFRHPQPDGQVDQLVGDERDHARPDDRGADAPELRDHLRAHVEVTDLVRHIVVDAGATDRGIGEYPSEDRAEYAADAVHAEHVERVVVAEHALQARHGPQADQARQRTEHDHILSAMIRRGQSLNCLTPLLGVAHTNMVIQSARLAANV